MFPLSNAQYFDMFWKKIVTSTLFSFRKLTDLIPVTKNLLLLRLFASSLKRNRKLCPFYFISSFERRFQLLVYVFFSKQVWTFWCLFFNFLHFLSSLHVWYIGLFYGSLITPLAYSSKFPLNANWEK